MIMHVRFVLSIAFAALVAGSTSGQTGGAGEPGGQYYIHGIFNPTIADVRKIDLRPLAFDSILPEKPINYAMLPAMHDVPARVDSIAPAKLNVVQSQQKLYKGYVKAGFGVYTTPLAEIYYDQARSRDNAYGIHYKHLSSNGGLDDVGPSDYSFNTIDGFYTHYLRQHQVGGSLNYDRRRVTAYGYDPIAFDTLALNRPEADDLKQVYSDIGFAVRVKSLYKDSSFIAHDIAMEVHGYNNSAQSRETNVKLTADLAKEEGGETYRAGLVIDNNAYLGKPGEGLDDLRQNGTLIGLEPGVSTEGDRYVVSVGAGIWLDAMKKTTFHFFPRAYLSYSLFDDILVPYAGAEGERVRNSFRSLTRLNPWTVDAPALVNSSKMYDVYGGMRGSVSSSVGFDVRVSTSRWKDRPLFINESFYSFGNEFGIVYDRVDVLDVMGMLTWSPSEATSVTGRIDMYTYDTGAQAKAWNLPPYEISLIARHTLREKLMIKAEVLFMGRRPALGIVRDDVTDASSATAVEEDLKGFLDLYLGAEYRYTKRFSIFAEVSNLSASKYERWYRYPVQRTLIMGGATYAF